MKNLEYINCRLTIDPAEEKHSGYYTCVASNRAGNISSNITLNIAGTNFCMLTVRNSSCGKVCFYRCLSVHRGRGVHPLPPEQTHTLPPEEQTPPPTPGVDPLRSRHPWRKHPLPPRRPLQRTVRILLECILLRI